MHACAHSWMEVRARSQYTCSPPPRSLSFFLSLLGLLLLLDPLNPLAHLPNALLSLALLHVDALAVLLALEPLAVVAAAIGPGEHAMPVLLVILVLADVLAAVGPGEDALALHAVVDPVAIEDAAVRPNVLASAMNVIIIEVALVGALVCPDKLALTMLLALLVLACILGPIRPLLHSLPVLLIIHPLPLVPAAIVVTVVAETISLVILPRALIHVALGVHEAPVPTRHSVLPEAVVPGAIGPYLNAATISLVGLWMPLPLVHGAILQIFNWFELALDPVIRHLSHPVERLERVNYLHHCLIVVLLLEYIQLTFMECVSCGLPEEKKKREPISIPIFE